MEAQERLVDFHEYCRRCKHEDMLAHMDPCNDCLGEPTNKDSRKPVNFEPKE